MRTPSTPSSTPVTTRRSEANVAATGSDLSLPPAPQKVPDPPDPIADRQGLPTTLDDALDFSLTGIGLD
jgi:hypothetical protein